jgi:hypothetical protein
MMKTLSLLTAVFAASLPLTLNATRLVDVTALDTSHLMVRFVDGEVLHRDTGEPPCAYQTKCARADHSDVVIRYGRPLNLGAAMDPANWQLISDPVSARGKEDVAIEAVYRKSKLNGMAELPWNDLARDYDYASTLKHTLYLELAEPLEQGTRYTLHLDESIHADRTVAGLTYDVLSNRSEAIHINLAGYSVLDAIKPADLYEWMGDGGPRDYSGFVGEKVLLLNLGTHQVHEVGQVSPWEGTYPEDPGRDLINGKVWTVDFTGFNTPGTYRLAVEGVGASPVFSILQDAYKDPFDVSILGFFYMRVGQEKTEIRPVPRQPTYIPGEDPEHTRVIITTMHPWHPEWDSFSSGDVWDKPLDWAPYATNRPPNMEARGGYADAYDWDRHMGHVSVIYDTLLPYILSGGIIDDDDSGIPESGNGIPDIIDTARWEVDFWLRLRDGEGYSPGLTNPTGDAVFYQAANQTIAAWTNAANAAILAEALRIAGNDSLADHYTTEARTAFDYASRQENLMLEEYEDVGQARYRGKDFRMMAAAFLYNLTGETRFEDVMAGDSEITSPASVVMDARSHNQFFPALAYLTTERPVHYPELQLAMREAILREARHMEVNHIRERSSRRATDDAQSYFWTIQDVQRTILAHHIAPPEDKRAFLDALILEASWGLGRNPMNRILMTTATTDLAVHRSIENIYTSGRNDGSPGVHPGHTPYLNVDDWAPSMIMGRPSWMTDQAYPDFTAWPIGEQYFNSRYVWTHSEFTPQQTMRGKMALYGYLHALERAALFRGISPAGKPEGKGGS